MNQIKVKLDAVIELNIDDLLEDFESGNLEREEVFIEVHERIDELIDREEFMSKVKLITTSEIIEL